jgi:hypothetical protein
MATSAASYRKPQPTLTLDSHLEQKLTPSQVAQTLGELCALGLVEAFQDERNVTRYKLVAKAERLAS